MKKFIFGLTVSILVSATVKAQTTVDLNVMGGYTFGSSISYSDGTAHIEDGGQYTAGLEISPNPHVGIQLYYSRMETEARYDGYYYSESAKGALNYIMLGGAKYFGANKAQGYAGLDLGCSIATCESYSSDVVKMALGFKLGARIMASSRVGIKLQAQLLSPIQGFGAGFYFGTGGSGTSVSTYSSILQFGFSGGLVFRISEK